MINVPVVSDVIGTVKEAVAKPNDNGSTWSLPKLPKLPEVDPGAAGRAFKKLSNRYSDMRLGLDAAVRTGKRRVHQATIGAKVETLGLVDRIRKDKKVRRRVKEDQDRRKKTGA